MFPIEILAQIGDELHGKDYDALWLTCRMSYKTMKNYSRYLYPMNGYQREVYNKLIQNKGRIKKILCLPCTGEAIILLNYVHYYIQENNKKVLIGCPSARYKEWRKALLYNFGSLVECIKNNDKIRLINKEKRIMLVLNSTERSDGMSNRFDYDLLIEQWDNIGNDAFYRSSGESRFSGSNQNKHYISLEYLPDSSYSSMIVNPSLDIVYRYKCPLPTYPSYYVDDYLSAIIDKLMDKNQRITILGASYYDKFNKNNKYKVFFGGQEKNFFCSKKKSILVYNEKYLRRKTPMLSGVVIMYVWFGKTHLHLIKSQYNYILTSSDITSLYYVNNRIISYNDEGTCGFIRTKALIKYEITSRLSILGDLPIPGDITDYIKIKYSCPIYKWNIKSNNLHNESISLLNN